MGNRKQKGLKFGPYVLSITVWALKDAHIRIWREVQISLFNASCST